MDSRKIEKILIEGNLVSQHKLQNNPSIRENKDKIAKYPVLILTCMDPWIDIHSIFNLQAGDILVLRNAGNIITQDMLRSIFLAISKFNIKLIIILGDLGCGMTKIKFDELIRNLGMNLTPSKVREFFQPFVDDLMNITNQVQTLKDNRIISQKVEITGMLYDPNTGYVFEREYLEKFRFIEAFQKNYLNLIQKKKSRYLYHHPQKKDASPLKEDINQKNQTIDNSNNELLDNIQENRLGEEAESELTSIQAPLDQSRDFQTGISMKLPKINIPKINIHVPQVYKKKIQK